MYTCRVEEGYSGAVVGYGLVLVCGVQLVLCVCWVEGKCDDTAVGGVEVLPMQLVFVGKLGCSHIFRLGVVGIEGLMLELLWPRRAIPYLPITGILILSFPILSFPIRSGHLLHLMHSRSQTTNQAIYTAI